MSRTNQVSKFFHKLSLGENKARSQARSRALKSNLVGTQEKKINNKLKHIPL